MPRVGETGKPKPKPVKKQPSAVVCKACGDTGKNSKGGDCYPCIVFGRIKAK